MVNQDAARYQLMYDGRLVHIDCGVIAARVIRGSSELHQGGRPDLVQDLMERPRVSLTKRKGACKTAHCFTDSTVRLLIVHPTRPKNDYILVHLLSFKYKKIHIFKL